MYCVDIRKILINLMHFMSQCIRKHKLEGIVEIDESYFGKRHKYHRGRFVGLHVWIVGLVERGSNKIILYPVEKRNQETLQWIIQNHVATGSTIYTDGWAAYKGLSELGYEHFVVEHKDCFKKFVKNPKTGETIEVHTNSIEGAWAHAKFHFKKMHGTMASQFEGHLCEVMWRNWHRGGSSR